MIDDDSAPSDHARMRNVIGCMTGTSIDAVDVALVAIDGAGVGLRAAVRRCGTHPLGALAAPLRRLATGTPMSAGAIAGLARDLALRHVAAIRGVAQDEPIDLIAVHGQTVYHAPPVSWQLLAPAPLAAAFGVPVVCDLRAADLAAGGQGAPITPLADFVLFRADASRAVLNLGGFANYTLLPPAPAGPAADFAAAATAIRGGDICACNQLLDRLARERLGTPFDPDGRHAAAGHVRAEIRDPLVALLRAQASAARSLGTGDELDDWIVGQGATCPAADLCRSACEALAIAITETIAESVAARRGGRLGGVLVAGGGANNRMLLADLKRFSPAPMALTDELGVPAGHREAAAMAILGALCQDRVPITLPAVTGVREPAPLAGMWLH